MSTCLSFHAGPAPPSAVTGCSRRVQPSAGGKGDTYQSLGAAAAVGLLGGGALGAGAAAVAEGGPRRKSPRRLGAVCWRSKGGRPFLVFARQGADASAT